MLRHVSPPVLVRVAPASAPGPAVTAALREIDELERYVRHAEWPHRERILRELEHIEKLLGETEG